jgi:hypothetical protein
LKTIRFGAIGGGVMGREFASAAAAKLSRAELAALFYDNAK